MIKINKLLKKYRNDWSLVLKEAKQLDDQGDLQSAILIYEAFLSKNASHPFVVESLASAFLKSQQFAQSLTLYGRLIKSSIPQASFWLHKGICEANLKRQPEALLSFAEALLIKPDYALAHNNMGKLLGDTGHSDQAFQHFSAAIALQPDYVDAYSNWGVTLQNQERHMEALSLLNQAAWLDPDNLKAMYHRLLSQEFLGLLDAESMFRRLEAIVEHDPFFVDAINAQAHWLNRHYRAEEALARYEQAILIQPKSPKGHLNRATLLNELQRYPEALVSFDLAISLDGTLAEAYVNRVLTLLGLGRDEEALASANKAIEINAKLPEAHSNCGMVQGNLQQFEDALLSFKAALDLNPQLVAAYVNRSDVFRRLGRFDESMRDIRCAIALSPERPEALVSRALIDQEMLDLDGALARLDRALNLNPQLSDAQFNKGLVNLLKGDLVEGARGYEWRWKAPLRMFARDFQRPLWLGDTSLLDKSILISSEQGLGDAIQHARYLPMLAAQAREVVVEAPASLLPLFEQLDGHYRWLERGQALPKSDLYCPIMSLPLAFRTELSTIPNTVPYLSATVQKKARWFDILGPKTKPRIGLAWSGNPKYSNDLRRSITISALWPLFREEFEFHAVQKDIRNEDAQLLGDNASLRFHGDMLETFADTAALLEAMDLVISVDTSIAHLSGALGRPTWILLSHTPDPRWFLTREDSPWYPSVRLFRQSQRGDWPSVVQRVLHELCRTFGSPLGDNA